jgi:hypothetical protein
LYSRALDFEWSANVAVACTRRFVHFIRTCLYRSHMYVAFV